ncbi:unnamed protein product [Prorocentrum cordatum]|uniref:ADP,ATP carrier protein n=1 Tax=Prorocentrum cordatum TaxID=2364126 RepID=A0ABN9WVT0_9DINO|nr:unnamed protein product [Polarella glacialis]
MQRNPFGAAADSLCFRPEWVVCEERQRRFGTLWNISSTCTSFCIALLRPYVACATVCKLRRQQNTQPGQDGSDRGCSLGAMKSVSRIYEPRQTAALFGFLYVVTFL